MFAFGFIKRLFKQDVKLLPGRWMNVGSIKRENKPVEFGLLAECDALQRQKNKNDKTEEMVMRASMMH